MAGDFSIGRGFFYGIKRKLTGAHEDVVKRFKKGVFYSFLRSSALKFEAYQLKTRQCE